MATNRTKEPIKNGKGGQSGESHRPSLEKEVSNYMAEDQKAIAKGAKKKKSRNL